MASALFRSLVVPRSLSRLDHFHPGGDAYDQAAKRIAAILIEPEQTAELR